VAAAGAGRVGDAELVRVQKEGVAVADVELLLLLQQAVPLVGQLRGEALSKRVGEVLVFFLRQLDVEEVALYEVRSLGGVFVLVRQK
jgi:hypothetical protein